MASTKGKRGKRLVSLPAAKVRKIVADNVQRLIDFKYPISEYRTPSERQKALKSDANVSWSTVQRLLNADRGKQIDIITDVAIGLGCQPGDLLTDGFARGWIDLRREALLNADPVILHRARGR